MSSPSAFEGTLHADELLSALAWTRGFQVVNRRAAASWHEACCDGLKQWGTGMLRYIVPAPPGRLACCAGGLPSAVSNAVEEKTLPTAQPLKK